ncbi:deleted in malignant brain tumors 1 protein-like [Patiria miniata]|uniref:SRCR domain-containing protein n=1 Tax=Patiria miniata TaxID=46514 RepID=A0A914B1V6_PATMI|nr:deleted in malignant brain tumors 1 protein-like [Patiria miniata]
MSREKLSTKPLLIRVKFVVLWLVFFIIAGTTRGASGKDPFDVQIRLVGGSSPFEGRVEIRSINWETVCDDQWDIKDAQVVCRQLGYGRAISATKAASFGQGSGRIGIRAVDCVGTEEELMLCPKSYSVSGCSHSNDAGVICSGTEQIGELSIRLVGGNIYLDGRVEVYTSGVWKTLCDDSWGMDDATVACRQLGYGEPRSVVGSAWFGQGSGDVYSYGLDCVGTEQSLRQCPKAELNIPCRHTQDAGVRCSAPQPDRYKIRLVNGGSPLQGTVEVYDGRWGTVCDRGWDMNDAQVVCRQLGYGDAVSAWKGAHFGTDFFRGPIVDNVRCLGDENFLYECQLFRSGSCGSRHEAGVSCSGTDPENGKVTLVDGDGESGRVVIYFERELGTICGNGWTTVNSDVLCKELGFTASEKYDGNKDVTWLSDNPKVLLESVNCEGDEQRLVQCSHSGWDNSDCDHKGDVWVRCIYQMESSVSSSLSAGGVAGVVIGSIAGFFILLYCCKGCLASSKSTSTETQGQGSATAYSQVPPGETVVAPPMVHYHPPRQSLTIREAASPSAPPSSLADEAPPAYDAVMARPNQFPTVPTESVHGGHQPVASTHPAVYPGPPDPNHPPSLMHPPPPNLYL